MAGRVGIVVVRVMLWGVEWVRVGLKWCRIVPVIGTRYCVEALGLPLKSRWQTWCHDNQVHAVNLPNL